MSEQKTVTVPDLGDFDEVEVVEVVASAGDELDAEGALITLETDKATMDVPTPFAGRVVRMLVQSGDRVSPGSEIAVLEVAADSSDEAADDASPARAAEQSGDDKSADTAQTPAANQQASDTAGDADDTQHADDAEPHEVEVRVPDIGDFSDVEVIDLLVAEGDSVEEEGALLTLETDKAAMDVPSPLAGKIVKLHVSAGDKVSQGDLVATLLGTPKAADKPKAEDKPKAAASSGEATSARAPSTHPASPPPRSPDSPPSVAPGAARLPPIDEAGFARAHAGPSVRRFARELGVDLGQVRGSGKKDRITEDDVKAFVKAVLGGAQAPAAAPALPQVPKVDFAKFGDIEERPLSRIQKISGSRLQASWINLPHVTQFDEADFTDTEERRQRDKAAAREKGVKLTPLAFIMRACVIALTEFPVFNSSLNADGDKLVLKKYIHLGFAADTPDGLVVPVVRDADKMDVSELAVSLADLAVNARDGKLKAADMQGGTFTVSSLGGIGGTAFTPIINAPEVAILGVSRSRQAPVYDGSQFVPRLMLPLSLSYDHRVIDGAAAARFTTRLGELLADPDTLMAAPE